MAFTVITPKILNARRWTQEQVSGLRFGWVPEVTRRDFKQTGRLQPALRWART
jgi:hypothetical protein